MQRVMHILIVFSLFIFFAYAVYALIVEVSTSYKTFKKLNGLSDTEKKNYFIGDLYTFATKCNTIIPENSNILFLGNVSNNQLSFDLLLNYYLYPRKLYWLNNVAPYPESPPELKELDQTFLNKTNIEWVIFRYPEEYGVNEVVKLESGNPVQSFNMD
jgi:hypothetical protein